MAGPKDKPKDNRSGNSFEHEAIRQFKRLVAVQERLVETTERGAVATEQLIDSVETLTEAVERIGDSTGSAATATDFDISSRFEPVESNTNKATSFAISSNLEPLEGDPQMPGRNIGGPVPENNRVVFTIVPTANADGSGAPAALDGEFNAVNDQAQAPVIDQSNPLSIRMAVDPTPDRTAISTITGGDTDGDPSFIATIDWDGQIQIVKAVGFNFTSGFEPVS